MNKPMPDPGPVALRAVDEAEMMVGIRETDGPNRNKFIDLWNKVAGAPKGSPYCMAFCTFRLVDAARDLGVIRPAWIPTTAYTPTFANAAKAAGRWISTAKAKANPSPVKRGDLAFFYMAHMKRIAHVEMVTRVTTEGVHTIGANTSDGSGVDRDGGGVYARFRNWASLGDPEKSGFARVDA